MSLRAAIPLAVAVVCGAVLAGCSADDGDPVASASPSPSAGASSAPRSSAAPPAVALPDSCDLLLPFTELDQALGRPLFGETVIIQGEPQPSISRTGRVTCRYGLRPGRGAATPPLEVGISGYTSPEAANQRVEATVAEARPGAASQSQVTVGGAPATVLLAPRTATLVLAQDRRTLAVTLVRRVVAAGRVSRSLAAVAEIVLKNLE